MCGIVGVIERFPAERSDLVRRVTVMADAIAHRGPDASGVFVDENHGVGLGHRRLAVVDLTVTGAQPMFSDDKRYVLIFNGEIYNANALRASHALTCRGSSDTEVLLRMLVDHGVDATLPRLEGMFAFALYDTVEHTVVLARDRFGKKPLYVADTARGVVFGSEPKALLAHPGVARTVDETARALYFERGVVPGAHAIFRGMRKLLPGHVEIFTRGPDGSFRTRAREYFTPESLVERIPLHRRRGDDAVTFVENAFQQSVERRLVADVPLGAFLSSGIDSTLVVSAMKRAGVSSPKTFTISIDDPFLDEGTGARRISQLLHTEHTEQRFSADELLETLVSLADTIDEPFADSSIAPTWLVSKLARQSVTVALSGDGADELFGGYRQHHWTRLFSPVVGNRTAVGRLAQGVRATRPLVGAVMNRVRKHTSNDTATSSLTSFTTRRAQLRKLIDALSQNDAGALALFLRSVFPRGGLQPVAHALPPVAALHLFQRHALIDAVRLFDLETYLPDDILPKVDRASMAVSLEVRCPFLDVDVARAAFSVKHDLILPTTMGPEAKQSKRVLREVLRRQLPAYDAPKKKKGFGLPLARWFRGPLRSETERLIVPSNLERWGLNPNVIHDVHRRHQSGNENWGDALFAVWMYLRFAERHLEG